MIKNLPSGLVSSVKDILKTSSEHLKEKEQKDLERLQQVKLNTDQIMEKLIGNQHKIDKNKNKKIDAHDFALLRKEKTSIKKEETELIDEAKRLIHHEPGDTYSAKVYRDPEYNEYQVHFFKHGKHMGEGPVSYHDDKEDAISTSKSALKQMHAKDKDVKEDVEQIDELSQEKMTSYMRAAKKDINKNLRSGDPQPGSKRAAKVEKRVAGYRKAWAKVERQNEEKDTPGNGYSHQCALHVKSEQFGEGRTLFSQHAEPDAEGNIEWYDVMFDEGIKRVYTNEIEILVSEAHMNHKKKKGM
jgi:hypothetical protein